MTYQPAIFGDDEITLAKLPGWVTLQTGEAPQNVAFLSGASFAALDVMLTQAGDAVPQPLLRNTLALKAAAMTSRLEGRMSRETDIRDAYHLSPPDEKGVRHWGPDGDVLAFWREVVGVRLNSDDWIDQLVEVCGDHELAADWLEASTSEVVRLGPIATAVQLMRTVLEVDDRAERLACCLADAVIARYLSWDHILPLSALNISKAMLRSLKDEGGEAATKAEMAIAKSAQFAFRLARALARRKDALLAIAPKLRSRGADAAVALFLFEDTVSPSGMLSPIIQGSRTEMSARNARRLCDRLVDLGVVKELTGRTTFRLYGVTP